MWDSTSNDPNSHKNVAFGGIRYIPPSDQSTFQPPTNDGTPNNYQANSNVFNKGPPLSNNYYTPLPIPPTYQPMADAAMTYGSALAGQGKQIVEQKFEKWMSLSRLKYYFAVDTKYVGKKLSIILFPYIHKDWALQYDQENQPIAPRYDVNAPDLYIPVMAFVTFILISGWILGLQKRFSPEQLGIQASSCLVWEFIEVLVTTFLLYLMNIGSLLRILDILAFSSYKYVGVIICSLVGMFFGKTAYYATLIYFGISIGYFLIKTLRLIILPNAYGFTTIVNQMSHDNPYSYDHQQMARQNNFSPKRKTTTYILLSLCFVVQPIIMAVLTYHLLPSLTVASKTATLTSKLKHKFI